MASKREASPSSGRPSKIRKILPFWLFWNNKSPSRPDENHGARDKYPAATVCSASGNEEQVRVDRDGQNNSSGSVAADGIAPIDDLEQAIMQKTFTRDEVDHLIEMVRSRTSDVSAEDERRRFEKSMSQPLEPHREKGKFPVQVNEFKSQTSLGIAASPSRSFLEKDAFSPTEVAKAYMGSRSLKATPLTSLRNQAFREDISWRTSLPSTTMSPGFSLRPKTVDPCASAHRGSENGYLTPGSRGRSDTYNRPCTPYSRVNQTAMLKGVDPMTGGKVGPSTSLARSWKGDILFDGKQSAKRRISVLDSDIGSVGHIRRIRRKTNMLFPSASRGLSIPRAPLPLPLTPIVSNSEKGSISSTQKRFQLDESIYKTSVLGLEENAENSIARKRSACVPSQSSETARKILEQLDRCMPSPKGKSPETKTTSVETSTSKSVPMLQGRSRQCAEDVDSLKLLHNEHGQLGDNQAFVSRSLTSPKQGVVYENGPVPSVSDDGSSPQGGGIVRTMSTEDGISSSATTNAVISCSIANASPETHALEKSANKDPLELEKNYCSSTAASNSADTNKAECDRAVAEGKDIAEGAVTVGEPMASFFDVRPTGSFTYEKSSDAGISDDFLVTNSTGTAVNSAAFTSLSTPSFNVSSIISKPTSSPFSFTSNGVDKATLPPFSPPSVLSESLGLNGTQSEPKLEVLSSTFTSTCKENGESVKANDESSSKTASTAPGIFSFQASYNSSPNHEPYTSSSSEFMALDSDNSKSNGVFATLSSIATTTTSVLPTTGSSAPSFVFGASSTSSASMSVTETVSAPFTWDLPTQSALSQTAAGSIFSSTSGSIFGSSYMSSPATTPSTTLQSSTSSIFGTTSASNTGFIFGSSPSTPMPSSLGTSSQPPVFSFTSAATATPAPAPAPGMFNPPSPGNDQMSIEEPFSSSSQPSTFVFGAPSSSSGPSMFQFSSQQNPASNPDSFGFTPGAGFAMGAGGGGGGDNDKSKRRFIKVKRDRVRKR